MKCFDPGKSLFQVESKVCEPQAERCQPVTQLKDIQTTHATLNLADVGLPKPKRFRERVLCEATLCPSIAKHAEQHFFLTVAGVSWHASQESERTTKAIFDYAKFDLE